MSVSLLRQWLALGKFVPIVLEFFNELYLGKSGNVFGENVRSPVRFGNIAHQ